MSVMSVFHVILNKFHLLKGLLQLYALHGPMFLFVDRLGFSLFFSAHSQIDIGCRRKMVVAGLVLAKIHFL